MNMKKLVKKAKSGNKEALLTLILAKKDELYRLAFSYMRNEHDALDALEDMIVIIYEKITQLKNPESFYSWSKTILVNNCKTTLKKQNRQILMDDITALQKEVTDDISKKQRQLEIYEILRPLSDVQREAIILKYLHDLDYQAIAELTNVSIGTAKSRVFNGIKLLQNYDRGEIDV